MKAQFVHGFLGKPSDWSALPVSVTTNATFRSVWADLKELKDSASFDTWADLFLRTSPRGVKAYGYSMGGRLLLHAYLKDPSHFHSLHLFSTNYGLVGKEEKDTRLKNDLAWANRFQTENWPQLIQAWNEQPVLANSKEPSRLEKDFDRNLLAKSLDVFSLGRQDFLLPALAQTEVPVHFINGEKDIKFMTLLDAVPQKSHLHTHRVADVGHRVLWAKSFSGQEAWW